MSRLNKINTYFVIFSFILIYGFSFVGSSVVYAQTAPSTVSSTSISPLSSISLACATTGINISWKVPSGTSSTDSVSGYITDTTTSSNVYNIPLQNPTSGSLLWTGSNGKDTYNVTGWIQNSAGQKSQTITSSLLNSSTCNSSTNTLSCNSFVVTQNGNTGDTVNSTSSVTISSGITSSNNSSINYSNANWTATSGNITPSNSNSSAVWSNGNNKSNTVTVSLSRVTDSNGGTLSSPCSVVLTIDNSSNLPATGFDTPTYVLFLVGIFTLILGFVYLFYLDKFKGVNLKRKVLKKSKS